MLAPPSAAAPSSIAPTKSRRRKPLLAAGGLAALAAVGGGAYLGISALSGSSEAALYLSRSDRGEIYHVTPGNDVGRENLVSRDWTSTGEIEIFDDLLTEQYADQVVVDGRTIIVTYTEDGETLLLATTETAGADELMSADSLDVAVLGDELLVREPSSGNDRCYRGKPDQVGDNQLFRGERCEFAASGDLITADGRGDEYEVEVVGNDGQVRLQGTFDSIPSLSADGTKLIESSQGARIWSVDTGEALFDAPDEQLLDWVTGPDELLAINLAADETVLLTVVDKVGGSSLVLESEGGVEALFDDNGDLVVIEDLETTSISRWDPRSATTTELASNDGLEFVGIHDGRVVMSRTDDFGVVVEAADAAGKTEVLYEYEADDIYELSLYLADGVVALYLANEEGAAAAMIDVGSPGRSTTSDGWDYAELLAVEDDYLVIAADDSGDAILVLLTLGSEPIEVAEFDSINSARIVGDTLYATVFDRGEADTFPFEVANGEPLAGHDYRGYTLAAGQAFVMRPTASGAVSLDWVRTTCRDDDLRIIDAGESIEVSPSVESRFCVRSQGVVAVSAAADGGRDPALNIEAANGESDYNDDDSGDFSARVSIPVSGMALVTVYDINGSGLPISVRTSEG